VRVEVILGWCLKCSHIRLVWVSIGNTLVLRSRCDLQESARLRLADRARKGEKDYLCNQS
jgi:hypothetical protein